MPSCANRRNTDPETGLDNFGARYNSSSLGRFLTPDWAGGAEAVPYGNLEDPQSLDLYTYVENNPVSDADPDGHYRESAKAAEGDDDWASLIARASMMHPAPYFEDRYDVDTRNHGKPHIDRTDKNGKLVGRYDENLDPIKFKGKKPPELSPKQRNSPEARAAQKRLRKLLRDWDPRGTGAGQGESVRFTPAVVPLPMMPMPAALAPDPLPIFTGLPIFAPEPIFIF